MAAHLFIRTGPHGGEIVALGHEALVVGRGKNCAIRLDDPFVSRNHFRIERRGAAYWVVDLGSSNRIAVNGLPTTTKELQFGDEIRAGSTHLVYMQAPAGDGVASEMAREITRHLPHPEASLEMVGCNRAMMLVYSEIQKLAPLNVTVLIAGESGTGKELVAQAIHRKSPRKSGPLVPVNCGAIARELIESEIFGHEKGAFTGAHSMRMGKFELAQGGTLFLDEIGELSLEGQAKLLRVIEDKRVTRLGGQKEFEVDVRIVAASHRDLRAMVKANLFRKDLLFRQEVVQIKVPPLRERKEDIPRLARHFLARFRLEVGRPVEDISPEALEKLAQHEWPGNVRELKNVIESAVIMGTGVNIEVQDIQLHTSTLPPTSRAKSRSDIVPIGQLIQKEIEKAIRLTGGNKKKAAEMLGIPRSSLYGFLDKSLEETKQE